MVSVAGQELRSSSRKPRWTISSCSVAILLVLASNPPTDHFDGIALRISHVNTGLSAESRSSMTIMPGLCSIAVLLNQSFTFDVSAVTARLNLTVEYFVAPGQ